MEGRAYPAHFDVDIKYKHRSTTVLISAHVPISTLTHPGRFTETSALEHTAQIYTNSI